MNTFTKLITFNFLCPIDLLWKVTLFNKETRALVNDNCWKGIMAADIEERTLVIKQKNIDLISDLPFKLISLF